MSRRPRRLLWLILLGALIGAGTWYLSRPEPVEVRAKTVDRGPVEATVANTRAGTVEACRRARLAPAIGGQIAELPVREGDYVQRAQILLELWNDDLAAELQLAQQEAKAAAARAEQACVSADVAQREADRLTKLQARGLASEEATERAVGQAKSSRAACAASRASIGVSRARVAVAQAALERTRLRAPFEGTVAEINGELGEFATPSPVGIPTLPAVDLVDTTCLYVKAPIDEVDAPAIRAGMPARISLDAFPERHFDGTVRRVAPYVLDVEKQARTVDVEAEFAESHAVENLLPGYSADVEIVLDRKDSVVRVPTEAVQEGSRVLVYRPQDRTLAERTITPGLSNWVYTEVRAGLEPGDRVITSVDREGVRPGAMVAIEEGDG
ncbi:MAG: efflux RND transporter periplasmic adaptor subunit [Gammaproteobacteria bacterium]|nr:efflux RND transporter periplasmic adaptor subunit [Gammaproteobacteria bacterium]NIR96763.1 efflux RND transporter periplasmic adaptor subunit [Gammaproteobacteria bacterium]NIT62468.1 efflux RND transporter periplasmic adaptor subunit [Gammaproteobacteria bacterium]NIV19403.1 efflux RND transporter periplasmic adaptor subunit [Gammaproteobacteria bacterium]NIX10491.1 efflux RND transporter periplasmic adaptor subunit [Gammaproteobacteria bacterium]